MPKVTKGILKKYTLRKKQHRCKFKQTVKVCIFYKDNSSKELGKRARKHNVEEINLKS